MRFSPFIRHLSSPWPLQDHPRIPVPPRNPFSIQVFEQWNRILTRNPSPTLEFWDRKLHTLFLRQQYAERFHSGYMEHQFVVNAHQAFLTQPQLQECASAGGIDARFGEYFVYGGCGKTAGKKGFFDLSSGLFFVLFERNFMRKKANSFPIGRKLLATAQN